MIQIFSLKSFRRRFPGQSGMSMAEMAMTMGLIGLGALGAASLSGNMASGSRKVQGLVSANSFASSLNAYLYSNSGCTDIKAMGGLSTTPQEVVLTKWDYQGIKRFEGGYLADGKKKTDTSNFAIDSMTAYYEPDPNPAKIVDKDGDLTKSVLKVKVRLVVGKKPQEYLFNVPVLVNPAKGNSVSYCSDEKNLAETCAAAQGLYNSATKECELGNACRIRDTWNRLSCRSDRSGSPSCSMIFGGSKTNKFTGSFSCPSGSVETRTQTETWVSKRDCGKKCTESITNTMEWAICLECPSP